MTEHNQEDGRAQVCPEPQVVVGPDGGVGELPQLVLQLRAQCQAVEAQLVEATSQLESSQVSADHRTSQVVTLIQERDDLAMQVEECSARAEQKVREAEAQFLAHLGQNRAATEATHRRYEVAKQRFGQEVAVVRAELENEILDNCIKMRTTVKSLFLKGSCL